MTDRVTRRLRAEVWIVLGLSLGYSGLRATWELVKRYLSETPIRSQTKTLNPSYTGIDVMDLIRQLLEIGFKVVPVALVLYLLGSGSVRARDTLGLVWTPRWRAAGRDLGRGVLLALTIGIPGIGVYVAGRVLGQVVGIDVSGLPDAWWSALVLLLSACATGLLEETVAVGYLLTRLGELRWRVPAMVLASAVLRASYHLYQGWPMAVGNLVMGVVFAIAYLRWKRLGPLIAAHALIDLTTYIGPEIIPDSWVETLRLA